MPNSNMDNLCNCDYTVLCHSVSLTCSVQSAQAIALFLVQTSPSPPKKKSAAHNQKSWFSPPRTMLFARRFRGFFLLRFGQGAPFQMLDFV